MSLYEDELEKLKKELAQLKEEYQDFAYIVSHDLSAPLRSISGFSDIIRSKHQNKFDENALKNFEYITKSVKDMKSILNALLDFSRLNTQKNAFENCEFAKALEEAQENLSELIETKQASIQSSVLPSLYADHDQIALLFYHLLHNALLYQKDKHFPEIAIKAKECELHWEFSIQDNGIGIKQNSQDKVFKTLRRAVTANEYPGIGMGLSISKKIVQRHQGNIWVESLPNHGSTFYFTIAKKL